MRLEIEPRDVDEDEADDRVLERPAVERADQPLAVGPALDVATVVRHATHYGEAPAAAASRSRQALEPLAGSARTSGRPPTARSRHAQIPPRRRPLLALACALPATAEAHPLGNFSVNHLTQVSVSADRVELRYVLDEAEIPTFQQRDVPDAELLARKQAEVRRRLVLTVDGRDVALAPDGRATLSHPAGQGGLQTTRVEIPLAAAVRDPRRVAVRDETFPGRVGWKAIVARPGRGTAVRSSVPAGDPTNGPAELPAATCSAARRTCATARFDVRPGAGTLSAPDGERRSPAPARARADDGLHRGVRRRGGRRRRAACCCCSRRSAGAPCTRSRPGTARRWWRRTSSGRAARRARPSRSARS